MKTEKIQTSQQGKGSDRLDQQKNQVINISGNQQNDITHEAGLGRHRTTDIEDLGAISGRDNYAGSNDDDDLTNDNLNASNDQ